MPHNRLKASSFHGVLRSLTVGKLRYLAIILNPIAQSPKKYWKSSTVKKVRKTFCGHRSSFWWPITITCKQCKEMYMYRQIDEQVRLAYFFTHAFWSGSSILKTISWHKPVVTLTGCIRLNAHPWFQGEKTPAIVSTLPEVLSTYDSPTKYLTIYAPIHYAVIGSDNGLSPGRQQAIIWTNAWLLWIPSLGTFKWNSNKNTTIFIQENIFWKVRLQNGGHFVSSSIC